MKKLISRLAFFTLVLLSISSKAQQATDPSVPSANATQHNAANTYKNAKITYELFSSPDNAWGYNIFVDGKLSIAQAFIPAVAGNQGFKTSKDAAKIAELMIEKMKSGEMPPTITIQELKKNNIIK